MTTVVRLPDVAALTATLRRRSFFTWAYTTHASNTVDLAMVDGLRQEADVLVCRDGRVEEDIPGGHGVGVLQLPMVPANPGDLPTVLHALYQGGSRTVLIAGDTPLSRLLHDANLVNRIV